MLNGPTSLPTSLKVAGRCALLAAALLLPAACAQQPPPHGLQQVLLPIFAPAPGPLAHKRVARRVFRSPVPLAPRDGVALVALDGPVDVRLRWSVPKAEARVRFFVEVVQREAGGDRAIFSAYVGKSEMTLPAAPGRYAWRVFAVADSKAHYRPSAWSEFGVEAEGAPRGPEPAPEQESPPEQEPAPGSRS